jgi:hypothetical protein
MREVAQDLQTLFDDRVTLLTFNMGNKADAAGVVFLLWGIETLALWQSRMTHS